MNLGFTTLAEKHIGLFECEGAFAIQRIDETAPDGYTDDEAIRDTIELAKQGNLEAIAALHLEGWSLSRKDHVKYIKELYGIVDEVREVACQ
jgi:hypothetical protein